MVATAACAACTGAFPLRGQMVGEREVVLTFDDGPNAMTSPAMLRVLQAEGIQALFFHVGANLEANPRILDRFRAAGQLVGIHTFSHPHLPRLGHDDMVQEIDRSFRAFENQTGGRPWFFRAPYGELGSDATRYLQLRGLLAFHWDVDSADWAVRTDLARKIRAVLRKGILLLHEHPWTTEQLPLIVAQIRASGYTIVSPLRALSAEQRRNLSANACPSWFHRPLLPCDDASMPSLPSLAAPPSPPPIAQRLATYPANAPPALASALVPPLHRAQKGMNGFEGTHRPSAHPVPAPLPASAAQWSVLCACCVASFAIGYACGWGRSTVGTLMGVVAVFILLQTSALRTVPLLVQNAAHTVVQPINEA